MPNWKKVVVSGSDAALSSVNVTGNVTAATFTGNGSGITNVTAASVAYSNISGLPTLVSSSGQIDHNATTNYVANRHIDHAAVSITAGSGLTGGGTIATTRTINVGAGLGITVNADDIALNTSSTHFTDGVKAKLNADQVLSGSVSSPSQGTVSVGGFTNIALGLQSGDSPTFASVTATNFTGTASRATVGEKVDVISGGSTTGLGVYSGSFSGSFFGATGGSGTVGPGTVNSIALFNASSTISSSNVFQSGNNVGIGTTTPTQPLHVRSAPATRGTILRVESTGTSGSIALAHSGNGGDVGYANLGAGNQSNVFYVTTGAGTIGSGFVMDNGGNVGIGTTSPQTKLHVNGNISASRITVSSTAVATNLNADLLDGQEGSYYAAASSLSSYLPLGGGTMTGDVNWGATGRGITWAFNTDGASIKFYNTGDGDTDSRLEFNTTDNNNEYFRWTHTPSGGSLYESMKLVPTSANNATLTVNGTVVATTFTGALNGNANTATSAATWTTARTLTIGSTGKSVNGSANVSWTLAEIGALGASAKAADSELLDGQDSTGFLRVLAGGTEANIDTYNTNGFRTIGYTGFSKHLLSWNLGGSPGTVQQEFDYSPGRGYRIRMKTDNTTWTGWGWVVMTDSNQGLLTGTVWTSGNDGATSGLDADLLDGQHGSYYAAASSLSSYLPLTGGTMTGTITGVSGTGVSFNGGGLADASLYNYILNGANDTGNKLVLFVNGSTRTADGGVNTVTMRNDGGNLILGGSAGTTNIAGTAVTINGNTVWHAANDGASSGLDADLLDGYHLDGATSVATRIFNNKGQGHNTYTNFNTVMTPGPNYLQGGTNGPTGTASHQWYGIMFGLGSEYGTSTGTAAHYASQLYYAREGQGGNQYLWARDMENGTWGSWRKLYAGYADSAGNATTFASQGEGQFVYGDSGRRRGVRLITNWNQTTYPDVSFLSSENNTTNAPSTDYTYGLQYAFHRDGAAYRTQIVTSLYSNPTTIWIRNSRDSDVWTSWYSLVHSGNIASQAVNYANSAGTISSQANSATITAATAATANTIALRDGNGDITVRELVMNVAVQSFTPSSMVAIYPTTNQAVKVDAAGGRAFLNVPTRTGGDASGNWGINITGNAATITSQANSATITATTAATADRIVLRDGNGDTFVRYGFASYFNMSHGVSGATNDTIFYSSYDDYIRKNNATGFRASLNVPTRTGGDASGTWGINVTGQSRAVYDAGYGITELTWKQTPDNFQTWTGGWASHMINNHGNGSDYYNQILIMPFWGPPQYMRKQGGTNTGPYVILSTENYSSYALPLSGGTLTGNITAPDFILSSDERLKINLTPLSSVLSLLEDISAYRYTHKKTNRQEVGVLAQEIRKILPEAVTQDSDGMLGVSYDRLVPLLLMAVKELSAKVKHLEEVR